MDTLLCRVSVLVRDVFAEIGFYVVVLEQKGHEGGFGVWYRS